MDDLKVRLGETLQFPVKERDETALTVRFIAKDQDNVVVLNVLESFEDSSENPTYPRVANFVIDTSSLDLTSDTVNYHYNLIVLYEDDVIEIFPAVEECEGECDLPELIVCESLLPAVS